MHRAPPAPWSTLPRPAAGLALAARPGPCRTLHRFVAAAGMAAAGLLPLGVDAAEAPAPAASASAPADEPASWIRFVRENTGNCVNWSGVQIQVQNTHPSRKLRVWLDREYMGKGTGDRSRSLLLPGAEPEALGCSRVTGGEQSWKIVKAQWVD